MMGRPSSKHILLLLAMALASSNAGKAKLKSQNFTSEWQIIIKDSVFPSLVAQRSGQFFYVSFPRDRGIKLESSRIINKPCHVPVPVHWPTNFLPGYANTLGNGGILVTLLEARKENNQSNVWMYLVDTDTCTRRRDKLVLRSSLEMARDRIRVVAYKEGFDVFIRDDVICKIGYICSLRFDDELKLVSGNNAVIPYVDEMWHIATVKDYDISRGYVYMVAMSRVNRTVIKQLDSNLQIIQKVEMNFGGGMAFWYSDDGRISMCFRLSEHELNCYLLDAQFTVKVETTLYFDSRVAYFSILRLDGDEAVVLAILTADADNTDPAVYIQHIGYDGKATFPILFQEHACDNIFDVNTFEVKDGLMCVCTVCQTLVNTKCMSTPDKRVF